MFGIVAVPEEGLLDPGGPARGAQPEEGVVLNRALPEVLAATLTANPEQKALFFRNPFILISFMTRSQINKHKLLDKSWKWGSPKSGILGIAVLQI